MRYQIWIVAAAALIFFTCLGSAALWDEDETLYASCAREMLQRNDWVVPMFNGQMFPDKPPLMFWLMIGGFKIFGVNEFGARFFSAILGIGTALLTYHLGRLLFNPRAGLWAGLITASSIIFTVSARAATVDSALVFVTTLAMLCFVIGFRVQGSGFSNRNPGGQAFLPVLSGFRENKMDSGQWAVDSILFSREPKASERLQFSICNFQFSICNKILLHFGLSVLLYVSLGIAILAKGPVGFLLPMASLGLFLMIVNSRHDANTPQNTPVTSGWKSILLNVLHTFHPKNFLKTLWQLRPITGVLIILAVALPWYILVGVRTEGLWLEQFFAKFNLRPFVQPILGHSGPVWYHIPAILLGFFPWSVFLGPAAIDSVRRIRERHCWRNAHILVVCWFSVFFIFWSICSTKLPHYLLPAYPALALLTGCFLETWITQPTRVGPGWMTNAWITTIAVGVIMMVAVFIAARIYLPGEEFISLVGLILVVGGYLCLRNARQHHRLRAATIFACMSAVFLTAMFGFAALRVDRHQNAKPLFAEIRRDSLHPAFVCAYRFFRQSMVYYAGHPIPYCDTPEHLKNIIATPQQAYIITLDKYVAEIQRLLPGQFREVFRQPRFLAADNLVMLARASQTDHSQTAARSTSPNRE